MTYKMKPWKDGTYRYERVIVCGGRDYNDKERVFAVLDSVDTVEQPLSIISGAAKGADTLAIEWARARGAPWQAFPADWGHHGKGAGHIRNQKMLDEGKPDLVIAFPGGRGTANMIERSKKAGVEVMEIE